MRDPELSVVVVVVEGIEALQRCLHALAAQTSAPELEILVPVDAALPEIEQVVGAHDGARAVPIELHADASSFTNEGAKHELYDRRRAGGLAAARGQVVALIEDRCVPAETWARQVLAAHEREDCGAVGGAVESCAEGLAGWGLYFCDYGRYQLPFTRGARDYVSDVNVSYPRQVLEENRGVWAERYNEVRLHEALRAEDRTLVLDPDVVVAHGRTDVGVLRAVRERFHWGRVFGRTQAPSASLRMRLVRVLAAPVLPAVLWLRLLRQRLERGGRSLAVFAAATPGILLFLSAWSLGEAAAYATPSEPLR